MTIRGWSDAYFIINKQRHHYTANYIDVFIFIKAMQYPIVFKFGCGFGSTGAEFYFIGYFAHFQIWILSILEFA